MSSSDETVNKLRDQTEQNRLNLLRTDLDMVHTLTDLVDTELKLNSHEHAVQTFARATKGYRDMRRIFEERQLWPEKLTNEIKEKLAEVRQELDRLQKLVHPPPQAR